MTDDRLCRTFLCLCKGIKAFGTDMEGNSMLLPILKLSYNEILSDAKIKILQALDKAGGSAESLVWMILPDIANLESHF